MNITITETPGGPMSGGVLIRVEGDDALQVAKAYKETIKELRKEDKDKE